MKKLIILFVFFTQFVFAQNIDTLRFVDRNQFVKIDSIEIKGNDITEEFIILRELTITEGNKVNEKMIKYNRERVYSLGLFNYVNFYVLQENNENILLIDVLEKWYLYPLPFLYFNEQEFKNPTYGINFKLENFRGRNETLSAFLAFGYDPSISLNYYNPALVYGSGIGIGASIGYQDFSNKSDNALLLVDNDFEYTIYSGLISLSKRLDQFNILEGSTGFSYIESNGISKKGITASGNSIDRVPFLSLQYVYDSRDLKQFPKTGIYAFAQLTHKGFSIDKISYQVLRLDFRQYNRIYDDITLRWRTTFRDAFGSSVPYYDYSYLGYSEYVRGHRDDKSEGRKYLLGSLEMSYTIVDEWDFSLDLPLLPKSLTSTRIGVNLNIFTDTGTAFSNFEELKFNNFASGYGFGLNILFLPFNSIRFEYAFDEYMNGEFLIGLGFSF